MSTGVRSIVRGAVLEIVLDRPKANAIDATTSYKLAEEFSRLRDDDSLKVGILTGGGDRIFSAGWDLKAAAERGESESSDYGPGGFAGLGILSHLNKPVICAVNGIAVGGGVEIALACDLVVAVEHASLSLPEISLGVMADAGGVQRLPRRLPRNVAMEMLLTGRRMSAEEALKWGLVNAVAAAGTDVMDLARRYAETIANGAPLAVRALKEVLRGIDGLSEAEALGAVTPQRFATYAAMLLSEDHTEGPRAFVEKRKPIWKGR